MLCVEWHGLPVNQVSWNSGGKLNNAACALQAEHPPVKLQVVIGAQHYEISRAVRAVGRLSDRDDVRGFHVTSVWVNADEEQRIARHALIII